MTKNSAGIPLDTWFIITSFTPVDYVPNLFYISKAIQNVIINRLLGSDVNPFALFCEHPPIKYSYSYDAILCIRFATVLSALIQTMRAHSTNYTLEYSKQMLKLIMIHSNETTVLDLLQLYNNYDLAADKFVIRMAARCGHAKVVHHLLVDNQENHSYAMLEAAEKGHLQVVKVFLINGNVDPTFKKNKAIIYAAQKGHVGLMKLLLSDNRVLNSVNKKFIFKCAVEHSCLEIMVLMLSKHVSPSKDNNYAIRCASKNGFAAGVKLLLSDKRVDPSANGNEAIKQAVEHGHVEVLKMLLIHKRVDPSTDDNYAIRWASANGHIETVKLLLTDDRVDPSKAGKWQFGTDAD
jgi:hypothetical protein